MTSREACAVLLEPSFNGPDLNCNYNANWLYRVWLPSEDQLGLVEVTPRYNEYQSYERARNSLYLERVQAVSALAAHGMANRLADAGFIPQKHHDNCYATTIPSISRLAAWADEQAATDPDGSVRFAEFNGDFYSSLEFVTNLKDGIVLIANATDETAEISPTYISENHPLFIHDMLLHVPAWLSLPPAIIREIRQAAGNVVAEYEAAVLAGDNGAIEAAQDRIDTMMGKLDGITAQRAAGQFQLTWLAQRRPAMAIDIGKITGKTSGDDAQNYDAQILAYITNPSVNHRNIRVAPFLGSPWKENWRLAK